MSSCIVGRSLVRIHKEDCAVSLYRNLLEFCRRPGHHYGMDLAALNIQRGRDHGLPSYNIWREQCGLHRFANWGELLQVMDDDTVGRLAAVYRHVDDIDLFPGGLAEKPVIRGLVGPTFACILGQQFLNLRRGDRFWFENGGFVSSLTPEQLKAIRKMSLARVLCDNLDDIDEIQPLVFRPPTENGSNARRSCDTGGIPTLNMNAWKEEVDTQFPGLQYSGGFLNMSIITTQEEESSEYDDYDTNLYDEFPDESLYELPQDDFAEYDEDSLQHIYSNELPRPFEEPYDEKSGKEDVEGSNHAPQGYSNGPSLAHLTDHNFKNVIEHAYSNTLFYGKKK
ncbi:hypothetical protein SK128_019714 [Halocaridina rubra]|uniref:Peroxidase n=1 Tax=Halocaridina rubra TaxID=373956 RepID=A0AAN8XBA3_HALRR